ncbi:hypothetical protein NC652_010646 [Populus alba x Populus x berolinensis]|nr:hypothetical protein NC652_010646 [Populus alba x Populus x berolinensis]
MVILGSVECSLSSFVLASGGREKDQKNGQGAKRRRRSTKYQCPPAAGFEEITTAYRWRNLRRTEERVRSIQKSLRKLVKSEEGAKSTKSVEKTPSTDRTLE